MKIQCTRGCICSGFSIDDKDLFEIDAEMGTFSQWKEIINDIPDTDPVFMENYIELPYECQGSVYSKTINI